MAQPKKNNSQIIVVLANRRTGSNYLMKVLNNFSEIEFFGEVFHWDTVWMPSDRKQQYVTWLKNIKGIDINIGDRPFEDKELVKLNHAHPDYLLDFMASTSLKQYVGFKIFPEHLSWKKLESHLLSKKDIAKIILGRNLLDVYISDRILDKTKRSQGYDTSDIKVEIDCPQFDLWYRQTEQYYSRISSYLKNNGQQPLELFYEDIHSYNSDQEKVAFIFSWLNKHGIKIKGQSQVVKYTQKQDKRKDPLKKVENINELQNYLAQNSLQHLAPDKYFLDSKADSKIDLNSESIMDKKQKIIIIFSTQRSGSTMVTSDFAQTNILGKPGEYFTEKIIPGSKLKNSQLNALQIKQEINDILQKASTKNGVVSIKVMSDYIIEIAKAIEKVAIAEKRLQPTNNLTGQQRKIYLQKLFVDFFNNLDIDGKFIAFRVYRKNKLKQAISRFVAAKTGLYHVWQDAKGQLVNHYDRPPDKATPFTLDIDKSYDYQKISAIIDSIYQEERELDVFLENFDISPNNLIYENITKNTDYLKPLASTINYLDNTEFAKIERKTVKTASTINSELAKKFERDGGYNYKHERVISSSKNVLKHISSFPDGVMVNESCFRDRQIIDINIDAPYLKSDDKSFIVIGGVVVSRQNLSQIFIIDPISGSKYQATINLKSGYYGAIYPQIGNSEQARFRCLFSLKNCILGNRKNHPLELNYVLRTSPVKFAQIDIYSFLK